MTDWFWIAFISALLSAAAALMQKKVLIEIDPLNFSFLVSALTAIFSLPFVATIDFASVKIVTILILFGKSILNAMAFLCIMTALKHLEISRALPVMAISPMVIAVLAFIFLGESLKPLEIAGIVLISIGTYSLELKKGEGVLYPFSVLAGSKHHRYLLTALALISISSVIDKALLSNFKLPPVTFLVFQNFFFFVIFFVIVLITGKGRSFAVNKNVLILIVVIAVVTVLYRWAQIEATKIAPVGLVISVKRLSVLFASIAGAQLFKEGDYVRRAIATILIVGGAMMIFRD